MSGGPPWTPRRPIELIGSHGDYTSRGERDSGPFPVSSGAPARAAPPPAAGPPSTWTQADLADSATHRRRAIVRCWLRSTSSPRCLSWAGYSGGGALTGHAPHRGRPPTLRAFRVPSPTAPRTWQAASLPPPSVASWTAILRAPPSRWGSHPASASLDAQRGPHGNSIRRVARSPVTRSAVTRSVARSMSRYLRPAAPSGPATCKHRAGNGLRRPCASGAQIHHDVDLLRAAESRRQCGGNRLVRRAPAIGPARCLSAMPVPHCERMPLGRRQKHAWIADSVHQPGARSVTSAIADRAALNEVHRQGSCGRGHVPTLGPQQCR